MSRKCLLFFIIISLFVPQIIYSADLSSKKTGGFHYKKNTFNKVHNVKVNNLEQVGVFKYKKNAEKFVKEFKNEGLKTEIRRVVTKDEKVLYKVFVKRDKKPLKAALTSSQFNLDTTLEPSSIEDKPVVRERPSWEPKKPSKAAVSSGEVDQIATL